MLTRLLLRRLSDRMVDFDARRFSTHRPDAREGLEAKAAGFIRGARLLARGSSDVHAALETMPSEIRGFAYEGAGFAAAFLAVERRDGSLTQLLDGPGVGYRHLVHTGVGWAMREFHWRSPKPWSLDPLLQWLALNGYGFSSYFFASPRGRALLVSQLRPTPAGRVIAQGVGRALWWDACADHRFVLDKVAGADLEVRSDLLCGAALAAVYAGHGEPGAGASFMGAAISDDSALVGVGALFGAVARYAHGNAGPEVADRLHQFLPAETPESADVIASRAAVLVVGHQRPDSYLSWQRRIGEQLSTLTHEGTIR